MCTPSAEQLDCGRHGGENEFLRKDAGEWLLSGWFNMQLCHHEAAALILDGADQEGVLGWGCRARVRCPSSLPFQAEKCGPAVVKLPLMLLKTCLIDSPPELS